MWSPSRTESWRPVAKVLLAGANRVLCIPAAHGRAGKFQRAIHSSLATARGMAAAICEAEQMA